MIWTMYLLAALGALKVLMWANELVFQPLLWGVGHSIFQCHGTKLDAIKRRPFRFVYLLFFRWPWLGVKLYYTDGVFSEVSIEAPGCTWTPPLTFQRT